MGHQPIGFAAQKTISGKYIERDWYQLGYGVWNLGAVQKRDSKLLDWKKGQHFAIPDDATIWKKRYEKPFSLKLSEKAEV